MSQLRELISKLRNQDNFKGLCYTHNPVYKYRLDDRSTCLSVLNDYAYFAHNAFLMLQTASLSVWHCKPLYEEVMHNIKEEHGLLTDGVPHLIMMDKGYRDEFSISHMGKEFKCFSTENFVKWMHSKIFTFDTTCVPYIAGALLAFEGHARDEFFVVEKAAKQYAKMSGIVYEEDGLINSYIQGHKEFEIGHENGLINAVESAELNILFSDAVVHGYCDVSQSLIRFWNGLYENLLFSKANKEKL